MAPFIQSMFLSSRSATIPQGNKIRKSAETKCKLFFHLPTRSLSQVPLLRCHLFPEHNKAKKNDAVGLLPALTSWPSSRHKLVLLSATATASNECFFAAPIACLRRILAGGGEERTHQEAIMTIRAVYTFPRGCWRPFRGFPHRTPNIYYETFHPQMSLKISFHTLSVLANLY